METTGFEDPMFSEFSSDSVVLNPMGPKAIQHHFISAHPHHHHLHHHPQTIMIGNVNGDIQHQRLPDVHQILPGNSPKMDHYKNATTLDYSHVKIEPSYSPNGKIEYINGGTATVAKLDSYTTNSNGQQQYSPNAKLMEFSTGASSAGQQQQHIEQQIQIYQQQPQQSLDGNQQNIMNGADGNFKRKSDENLNNLSGSPTPTTINSVSPNDANVCSTSPNKKPVDKKKNDPNGIKKKKTR
jgi:hypothetical protein